MNIKKVIPILDWLPNYNTSLLKGDLIAGITVGIVLIPQGIAYALIAGLPPIYGLYCALVPQIMYAIFGSSKQVAIGPVAMDSLIVATGVSTLALAGSESYISIAILLALMVGSIQFIMGIFSLGFIVNFLSKPVITGFTSSVALIIGINQFRNLLGVDFIQSDQIQYVLADIWVQITNYNYHTTIIGVISVLVIIAFRKINKKIPNALIVVVLGILIMKYFEKSFNDKTNPDFTLIDTISAIEPGDYIAFGYHTEGHRNTGHIMLIVATRSVNDYQVEVVVLDESSLAHTDDTRLIRKNDKPVPFTDAAEQNINDAFIAFYWGDGVNHTLEYPIAIGRGEI